jgi:predicted dinucleotide-binding enzyme
MDHASAHLMELTSADMETKIIESKFTHEEKKETLHKGEKATHHKEQHEELAYYKEIAAAIKNYEKVLLFGPTEAKVELLNMLKADHHFDKIDIEVKNADKMTENQQYAFVKEYFFKHLSAKYKKVY